MRFLKENSLSLVLVAIFFASLVGHAITGFHYENDQRRDHGKPPESFGEFLKSGEFIETVFENWESEFLQMGIYVIFTVFLRQKGSSESKKIDEKEEVDEKPEDHRDDPNAPAPVRKGGFILKLYKNSLSLAFLALFLVSFVLHAVGGAMQENEEREMHGDATRVTTLEYMKTSRFWFESFQNWQSEFIAVLAIVVLSIYLRQQGSPESKPVHAAHSETGSS